MVVRLPRRPRESDIAAATFDVCVIGHIARDINTIGGAEHGPRAGGAAYYATMVHARLGLRTAVLTKVAADDAALLDELAAAGVTVFNRGTPRTTTFRNIYPERTPDIRIQRVDAQADPLRAGDLPSIRCGVWQIGPLTDRDIDPALIARCAQSGGTLAMDVQGLTRRIVAGEVRASDPRGGIGHLRHVAVLKADDDEILTYTGCGDLEQAVDTMRDAGVAEILITRGSHGALVFAGGDPLAIDAVPPRRIADATGCGDTFLAAYMARRMGGADRAECARFAATVASLKIEAFGAFRGNAEDIAGRRTELGF